jgi:prepilin-type N-terminal cleavage/methylation domain-containing protein
VLRQLLTALRHRERRDDSSGFTLIELLLVISIMPIFFGTVMLAMFTAARWDAQTGARVGAAGDAQATASVFYQDAASALLVTTNQSQTQCGPGTVLFSVQWTELPIPSNVYNITSSYVEITTGTTTTLYRQVCINSNRSTPRTKTLVAANINPVLTTITFPASYAQNPAGGWVTTQGLSLISLTIVETGNGNAFTLTATPMLNASINGAP